jgi:hypothetical protein
MEDILDLYESEYDVEKPVVCVDEKSYQLLDNHIEPIPMRKGESKKVDYEYKREGTCNIFMISEPFNGFRDCKVTKQRTKKDFARLLEDLSDKYYPKAKTIRLVMDNLNTHKLSVLYEYFPPKKARRIAKRFEIHYTPVHGSWLNIAKIEIAAMAKQSINRRIPNMETLQNQLKQWVKKRNDKNIGVKWRFTTNDARIKLKRLYPS